MKKHLVHIISQRVIGHHVSFTPSSASTNTRRISLSHAGTKMVLLRGKKNRSVNVFSPLFPIPHPTDNFYFYINSQISSAFYPSWSSILKQKLLHAKASIWDLFKSQIRVVVEATRSNVKKWAKMISKEKHMEIRREKKNLCVCNGLEIKEEKYLLEIVWKKSKSRNRVVTEKVN